MTQCGNVCYEREGNMNLEISRIERCECGRNEPALTLGLPSGCKQSTSSPRDREIHFDPPLMGGSDPDLAGQASPDRAIIISNAERLNHISDSSARELGSLFTLKHLVAYGSCYDKTRQSPPNGLQLVHFNLIEKQ